MQEKSHISYRHTLCFSGFHDHTPRILSRLWWFPSASKSMRKYLYLFPACDIFYKPSFGWYRHENPTRSSATLPPYNRGIKGLELKYQMDILEELKARDERIEKLEKALLLVLSLNIGNHLDKSTKNCFSHVQTFAVEQMETLVAEGGSTAKVIEDLLAASEKRFRDELAILGRAPSIVRDSEAS